MVEKTRETFQDVDSIKTIFEVSSKRSYKFSSMLGLYAKNLGFLKLVWKNVH